MTGGKGLAFMVSKLEITAYLALLFPSKTKLLPSVYQISSGLVRVLLTIPLGVLSSGPRFLGKSERRESLQGVSRRVAGLRTSQGVVVRPGFSINTT